MTACSKALPQLTRPSPPSDGMVYCPTIVGPVDDSQDALSNAYGQLVEQYVKQCALPHKALVDHVKETP